MTSSLHTGHEVQSAQLVFPCEDVPKKTRIPSARKVMIIIFWDSLGIVFINLEKERTITRQYYSDLLSRIHAKLKRKQSHLAIMGPP